MGSVLNCFGILFECACAHQCVCVSLCECVWNKHSWKYLSWKWFDANKRQIDIFTSWFLDLKSERVIELLHSLDWFNFPLNCRDWHSVNSEFWIMNFQYRSSIRESDWLKSYLRYWMNSEKFHLELALMKPEHFYRIKSIWPSDATNFQTSNTFTSNTNEWKARWCESARDRKHRIEWDRNRRGII